MEILSALKVLMTAIRVTRSRRVRRIASSAFISLVMLVVLLCGVGGQAFQQSTIAWPVPIPPVDADPAAGWIAGGWDICSPFGWREHPITGRQQFHDGVDLCGPQFTANKPVTSVFDGTVSYVGWDDPEASKPDQAGGGQMVVVTNGDDQMEARFAHLQPYRLYVQLQGRVGIADRTPYFPLGTGLPDRDDIAIDIVCDGDEQPTFVPSKIGPGTYQFLYDRPTSCETTVQWPDTWRSDDLLEAGGSTARWATPVETGMMAQNVALRFRAHADAAEVLPGDGSGVAPGSGLAAAMEAMGLGQATVTSWYGPRPQFNDFHNGLDFAIDPGTPIKALFGGIVDAAGYRPNLEGNFIVIRSPSGQRHYFGHMRDLSPYAIGDVVPPGAVVGYIGQTGLATGPHTHFMLTGPTGGDWIDPAAYFNAAPPTPSPAPSAAPVAQHARGALFAPTRPTVRQCERDGEGRQRCRYVVGDIAPLTPSAPYNPVPFGTDVYTGTDSLDGAVPNEPFVLRDAAAYTDTLGTGTVTATLPFPVEPVTLTTELLGDPDPGAVLPAESFSGGMSSTKQPQPRPPVGKRYQPIAYTGSDVDAPRQAQVDEPLPSNPPPGGGNAYTSVLGPPTITVDTIQRVLTERSSPAVASAQAFYNGGVAANINPAFVLAMFIKESNAGTDPNWAGNKPDGTTTHNVGNIGCTTQWTNAGGKCFGRFRDYPSWEAGIADVYRLLSEEYIATGLTTVEQVITKWAPPTENNTAGYIQQVKQLMAQWASGTTTPIDFNAPCYKAAQYAITKQGAQYSQGGFLAGDPIDPATGTYYPRTGPNSFDCSGLIWAAYKQAGITLGWTTHTQQYDGVQIPCTLQDLRGAATTCWAPGDTILLFDGGVPYHTSLYVGSGLYMDCFNHAVDCVLHEVQTITAYQTAAIMARRITNGCSDHLLPIPTPGGGTVVQPEFVPGGPCVEGIPTFQERVEYLPGCGPPMPLGDKVAMLDHRVGYVGQTGETTGPHLDLGLRVRGINGTFSTEDVCTTAWLDGRPIPTDTRQCQTTQADPEQFLPRANRSEPLEAATAAPEEDQPYQLPPPGVPGGTLGGAAPSDAPAGAPVGEYWSPFDDIGRFGGDGFWDYVGDMNCWLFGNIFPWCDADTGASTRWSTPAPSALLVKRTELFQEAALMED